MSEMEALSIEKWCVIAVGFASLAAFGLAVIRLVMFLHERSGGRAKWKAAGVAVACECVAVVSIFMWYWMPFSPIGKPLKVASLRAPNGAEVMILQVFTGTSEPYEVSLFVRYTGKGPWTQYVIDPDGLYWRARLSLRKNDSEVVVSHGRTEEARLDLTGRRLIGWDGSTFGSVREVPGDPEKGEWVHIDGEN